MDMLDQALDGSGQDKGEDSTGSDDQVPLQSEGSQITFNQDGGMYVTTGEEGEQAAAIASVTPQGTLTLDPTVQYQFRADTAQGQVTYRVVQVSQDGTEGQAQVVANTGFPAGTQVAQAVIQSPFSNGGSPNSEALGGETRFTYVPTVSAAGDANEVASIGQVTAAGGQFYVMMSPQDVLQGQRTIAPRTHTLSPRIESSRSSRDERRRATHNEGYNSGQSGKRRATHNEVERRRRDKINNWIVQLSKLVPECTQDHTKQSQVGSKGGILAKACDYISELRTANARMAESLKETERLAVDVELLRQQCEELKQENAVLRAQLQHHGIVTPDISGNNS